MVSSTTTSIIAVGCGLAGVDANILGGVVSSNTKTNTEEDVGVRVTTTNNNNSSKGRRLLQKFKKKREARYNAKFHDKAGESDVGILNKATPPRFLQDTDYEYYCPRDTCPTALCDCADGGGSLEDCTPQLQDVCRQGKLGDCVFKDYVAVYEEVYCPFAFCQNTGHREDQCDCAFYKLYCDRLQGEECTDVLDADSTDPDKKPFFGCDEEELAAVCDEADACKKRGDLQGLDLGTWQGSVMTGLPNSSDKLGGGSVVMGVAALSMMWLMVNV